MFKMLPQATYPEPLQLFTGNVVTQCVYVQESSRLPVKFHVDAAPYTIEQVLQSSLVQWHLTGADFLPGQDPAAEEHFGISIVEGTRHYSETQGFTLCTLCTLCTRIVQE